MKNAFLGSHDIEIAGFFSRMIGEQLNRILNLNKNK